MDIDTFHTFLNVETFNCGKNLQNYLEDNFSDIFGTKYVIVSFLYSVVLTKGPENVISERQDMDESLIGRLLFKNKLSDNMFLRPCPWSQKPKFDKPDVDWNSNSECV